MAGGTLGVAHLPRPVEVGDAACLAHGPPLRITRLADGGCGLVAEVEPVRCGS